MGNSAAQAFFNDLKNAPAGSSGGGNRTSAPDGTHVVKVKGWEKANGQYGEQLAVKFYYPKFSNSDTYFAEETAWFNLPDINDENEKRAKARGLTLIKLAKGFGVDLQSFDDLFSDRTRSKIMGAEAEITKKTNGKYTNWFVEKLLTSGGNGKIETPPAAIDDSDIPF